MNEIKGQELGVKHHKQGARQKQRLWGGILGLLALVVVLGLAAPGAEEAAPATLAPPDAATQAQVSEAYGKLPLYFEANQGQTDARATFLVRGPGYTLFLTPTEAVLVLRQPQGKPSAGSPPPAANLDLTAKPTPSVLRLQFVGANP